MALDHHHRSDRRETNGNGAVDTWIVEDKHNGPVEKPEMPRPRHFPRGQAPKENQNNIKLTDEEAHEVARLVAYRDNPYNSSPELLAAGGRLLMKKMAAWYAYTKDEPHPVLREMEAAERVSEIVSAESLIADRTRLEAVIKTRPEAIEFLELINEDILTLKYEEHKDQLRNLKPKAEGLAEPEK